MSEKEPILYQYCLPAGGRKSSMWFGAYRIETRVLSFTKRQQEDLERIRRMQELKEKRFAYALPRRLSRFGILRGQHSLRIELAYRCRQLFYKRAVKRLSGTLKNWQEDKEGELVLGVEAAKLLPPEIRTRRMTEKFSFEVHTAYAIEVLNRILKNIAERSNEEGDTKENKNENGGSRAAVSVFLPKEQALETERPENIADELLQLLREHQEVLADLIFYSQSKLTTEQTDALLEVFEEETGIAACCYEKASVYVPLDALPYDKIHVIVDFGEMPINSLFGTGKGEVYFIDGSGVRSRKEIRKMNAERIQVKSLLNSLDRGFQGGL